MLVAVAMITVGILFKYRSTESPNEKPQDGPLYSGMEAVQRPSRPVELAHCPPRVTTRPSSTHTVLLAFPPALGDCIQRQIVFAAWIQSLQQWNILIIFADSEQCYFAISAGLISGCLKGSA